MKKFEITVTTKQGEKKVCVYVDSETASMLKDCPEEIRNMYLQDEYKEQLEKDYYVTLVLDELAKRVPELIFKGGTSLSTLSGIIH